MSNTELENHALTHAFQDLRRSLVQHLDPVPHVRRRVARRRAVRRAVVGVASVSTAVVAFAVLGPGSAPGRSSATVAAEPTVAASDATGSDDIPLQVAADGASPVVVGPVEVSCQATEVEDRAITVLIVESRSGRSVVRLQGQADVLSSGAHLRLPLAAAEDSNQVPALFELFAALPHAGQGPEASSTSSATRGTIDIASASCEPGATVEMTLDVWLGSEQPDGEPLHVVGRAVGTVSG